MSRSVSRKDSQPRVACSGAASEALAHERRDKHEQVAGKRNQRERSRREQGRRESFGRESPEKQRRDDRGRNRRDDGQEEIEAGDRREDAGGAARKDEADDGNHAARTKSRYRDSRCDAEPEERSERVPSD